MIAGAYLRVSTAGQDHALQRDAVRRAAGAGDDGDGLGPGPTAAAGGRLSAFERSEALLTFERGGLQHASDEECAAGVRGLTAEVGLSNTARDSDAMWPGAYPRRPKEQPDGEVHDLRRAAGGVGDEHVPGLRPQLRSDGASGGEHRGGAALGGGEGAAVRESASAAPPAIACTYCRTGGALRYLKTHAAAEEERAARKKRRKAGEVVTGPEPEAELHDPGCTTAPALELLDQGAEVELFCQECGQRRSGDRWRWAFTLGNQLRCPRCGCATEHHRAPREVVAAEECLCGACRTRRKFDEDATSHGRIAA